LVVDERCERAEGGREGEREEGKVNNCWDGTKRKEGLSILGG